MRVAAVQLEVVLGDVSQNLAESERLVRAAAAGGAELVALPEFFTTGVVFLPEIADGALPPDGRATAMLTRVAADEGIWVGGSFLCSDLDGECRNAWLLAGPDGRIHGRHDKDLPTMWENAFYIGGDDDGVIEADGFTVGASVCWEFMRTATARRLVGRVDLVVGGSNWWSIPGWPPRAVSDRMEASNARTAHLAPSSFGRFVGAPVVHGAICGAATCPMPGLPVLTYRGHFEGGAVVADATGEVLAYRGRGQGSGFVVAEVEVSRVPAVATIPDRFWLHPRGPLSTAAWHGQRLLGRRWYRRNVRK
ncbi:MAG: carbon-nitrogen hydrolase family protein [Thermoleophilia bacterium]|nr:carbon-nitrogen hydrolase family protein [Thermoleophilia bacterium]